MTGAASAAAVLDAGALRANLETLRSRALGARVMAVIKADAYGHGAEFAAQALRQADAFAVARLEEARVLRAAGIDGRILLLSGVHRADDLDEALVLRLDVGVQHAWQVAQLADIGGPARADAWLKVDTGMHRLGVTPADARAAYDALSASRAIRSVRVMTHFASADDADDAPTRAQLDAFEAVRASLPTGVECSAANSAGLLAHPPSHYDWVRPGLALYGASPFAGSTGEDLGLRAVMRLETVLLATKEVEPGGRIGYGGIWTAGRPTRIGIAAIGYADGYPRHVAQGAPVLVGGHRCTLVGRVSMDLVAISLERAPAAAPGDLVTLWGNDLPVEQVARAADTIPYTLLAGVMPRVERVPV